ncbi:hypothetical protein MCAMS1_01288 [biofilm metagenome]
MTSIRLLWLLISLAWLVFEFNLMRDRQIKQDQVRAMEIHSRRWLWLTLLASLMLALLMKNVALWPIAIPYLPRQALSLLLFVAGIAVRMTAINQLKHLFTTHVTIQHGHHLITDGLYRWVRHPAYSGLLLALFAAGLAMGDFIALLILLMPPLLAFNHRINIEEKFLCQTFAMDYLEYSQRTKKIVPWVL